MSTKKSIVIRADQLLPRDSQRLRCYVCGRNFTLFRRRHHCEMCGEVVCHDCTLKKTVQVGDNEVTLAKLCISCVLSLSSRQSNQDAIEINYPLDFNWDHPWPKPPTLSQEETRLDVVQSYAILDTPAESAFDIVADLAAREMNCPIAAVRVMDKDRQWLKARIGLTQEEIPRSMSICAHAIFSDKPLVVLDTLKDKRFVKNPLVVGSGMIRFYAGCPILTANGHALGTVFVFDVKPHDSCEVETLQKLAIVAMKHLEDRKTAMLASEPEFGYELDFNWEYTWPKPPVVPFEEERLEDLKSYGILDASADDELQVISHLASDALKCPIVAVSCIADDYQWFLTSVGLAETRKEIPRNVSFCAHTIFSSKPLVVLDTLKDKRFATNPLWV
ncbi:hypothetical protein Ae201684P_010797 [Aphanomyces euteiches]|nr:hypothetical protein Ae201684P_010797 [Aphanomyces euteiches]